MPASIQPEDYQQNNTVNSQFNNTFASSVKELGSSVSGFLKTAVTSVSDSLNNIGSAAKSLGEQGMAAGTSVSQAINQLSALGNYSKFNDTFVPPSKLTDKSPEQSFNEAIRYLGGLTFPENLAEYYIILNFKAYDRKVALAQPKQLPVVTINLPIPTNLQEQFSMQYADKQLGVAGYVEGLLPKSASPSAAEEVGRKLGSDVASTQGLYYGARSIVGLSDSVSGAFDKATGSILNPFQALLFQGVNLRSHSFTFKLSPNSQRENETLKKIIFELKRRMHPTNRGLIYEFPDTCDISFGKQYGEPYFFKTCFLESMTLNYAPSGTPAFFVNTGNPVEVEISLSFKETAPITREDFKEPIQPTYYDTN